jgi:hypothetical protein
MPKLPPALSESLGPPQQAIKGVLSENAQFMEHVAEIAGLQIGKERL